MTANLLQIAQAADDPDYRCRVKAAIFITASKILSTPLDDDAPMETRTRRYLAGSASGAAETLVWQFAWLMATHPTVAATIGPNEAGTVTVLAPDALLLAACSAAWDVVAGITR